MSRFQNLNGIIVRKRDLRTIKINSGDSRELGYFCDCGASPNYTFEQLLTMNKNEIEYQLREARYNCEMYLQLNNRMDLYREWQNYYHDVEKVWRCMNG